MLLREKAKKRNVSKPRTYSYVYLHVGTKARQAKNILQFDYISVIEFATVSSLLFMNRPKNMLMVIIVERETSTACP